MRSSYLSSDVCSSDLQAAALAHGGRYPDKPAVCQRHIAQPISEYFRKRLLGRRSRFLNADVQVEFSRAVVEHRVRLGQFVALAFFSNDMQKLQTRSEEHTSELQSLMRISYAVFCLKKKRKTQHNIHKQ